ncbi:MAG: hypothetical protein AAB641_00405 [Patescibacteria group bacterium]
MPFSPEHRALLSSSRRNVISYRKAIGTLRSTRTAASGKTPVAAAGWCSSVGASSAADFDFRLGDFGNVWYDYNTLLCFCEVVAEAEAPAE